ncbi:MAG: molybdenum ABC transporter permease [Candidatus Aminicenantes bacterium]|nr:MAG: molybdenum ABC transporter permease [Candidatus Aminicenantes bacterium]
MRFRAVFGFLGFLLVLFVALPILRMFWGAEGDQLLEAAAQAEVRSAIFLTLRASLWATLLALFLGIPLAYLLARLDFKGKQLIEGLIDLPVVIPHTAAGIALLLVWGRHSLFTRATGWTMVGTEAGITLAMLFVSLPFLVNGAKEGFRLVDVRLENTARTLGATPFQAFWTVSLPLAKKSILSGAIMMWARGISEFGAVVILAYHPLTAPVLIFERFQNFGLRSATPVAVLLLLLSLLVIVFLRAVVERR